MRTAIFILGMMISNGLQNIAQSNGYELMQASDGLMRFFAYAFIVFAGMDIVEFSGRFGSKE